MGSNPIGRVLRSNNVIANQRSYILRRRAAEIAEDTDSEIVLDGVEFVSRAFADELLYQSKSEGIELVFRDVSEDVEKMFEIIQQSREE